MQAVAGFVFPPAFGLEDSVARFSFGGGFRSGVLLSGEENKKESFSLETDRA